MNWAPASARLWSTLFQLVCCKKDMAPTRQVVGWATGRVCHENDSPLTLGGARAHDIWRYATSLGITHWHEVEWRLFPPGYIDPLSPCDGSPAQLRGWHWHRVAYRCRGHSRHLAINIFFNKLTPFQSQWLACPSTNCAGNFNGSRLHLVGPRSSALFITDRDTATLHAGFRR